MPDIAYQTLGVVLALVGAALAWRALFHDRPRGRRRCPKCWYDLRASDSLTCSECGYTARRERQLFKTRRRWRWAVVSVLLILLGASMPVVIKGRRDGWPTVVPNTALIIMVPWFEDGWPINELTDRHFESRDSEGELKDWLWAWQSNLLDARIHAALTDFGSPRELAVVDEGLLLLYCRDRHTAKKRLAIDLLDHPDPDVRYLALELFDERETRSEVRRAASDEAALLRRLIELTSDSDQSVAGLAILALDMFPDHAEKIVPVLRAILQQDDQPLAWEACLVLEKFGNANRIAIPDLVAHLKPGDGPAWIALDTLVEIGDLPQDAMDAIVEGAANGQLEIRGDCLAALFELEYPREQLYQIAVQQLTDPEAHVRGSSIVTLCRMDASSAALLETILASVEDVAVARDVAGQLARYAACGDLAVAVLVAIAQRPSKTEDEWSAASAAVCSMQGYSTHAAILVPVLIELWRQNVDESFRRMQDRQALTMQRQITKATAREDFSKCIAQTLGSFGSAAVVAGPILREDARRLKTTNPGTYERKFIETIESAIRQIEQNDR
ncbi:MAG: hypothetical protein IT430_01515 [Phycisphaerales bacterium]|nr:hypothetical protein [Phycisphaerales bacterium]